MISVIKNDRLVPFSRGIMAKSITGTGVSIEEAYEIVSLIRDRLKSEGIDQISAIKLKKLISKELLTRGKKNEERYYRVRNRIKYLSSPLYILIGGGAGVGKSTISAEIGHRLGLDRVIGTDTIREIMRAIISPELIPTLHESTFIAGDKLRMPYITNKLIYAFEKQVDLISEGLVAVMKRGKKEGLSMVLNGIHIVPGYIESFLKEKPPYLFQYVLDVPDIEQHTKHFYARSQGSARSVSHYTDNIDRIREIHAYILEMAKRQGVMIVKNVDFDKCLRTILEDIITTLEKEIADEK